MATAEKYSAKEAAQQIGTDARTLRKFIRSQKDLPVTPVGQGNRYEFTAKEIKALKKQFLAWGGGKVKEATPDAPAKKAPAKKKGKKTPPSSPHGELDDDPLGFDEADSTTEEVDLDDEGEPVDLTDLDPSDEDLDEIEIEDIDLD